MPKTTELRRAGERLEPPDAQCKALSISTDPGPEQLPNKYLINHTIEIGLGPFVDLSGQWLPSSGAPLRGLAEQRADPRWEACPGPDLLCGPLHGVLVIGCKIMLLFKKKERKKTGPYYLSPGRHPVPLPHCTGSAQHEEIVLICSKFSVQQFFWSHFM